MRTLGPQKHRVVPSQGLRLSGAVPLPREVTFSFQHQDGDIFGDIILLASVQAKCHFYGSTRDTRNFWIK